MTVNLDFTPDGSGAEETRMGVRDTYSPDDPDFVPVSLRLNAGIVLKIDAAIEQLAREDSPIQTRAEFAEYAVLFALESLAADAAAIWIGNDAASADYPFNDPFS